jgi:hypothetical protein
LLFVGLMVQAGFSLVALKLGFIATHALALRWAAVKLVFKCHAGRSAGCAALQRKPTSDAPSS